MQTSKQTAEVIQNQLKAINGTKLTHDERIERAIELAALLMQLAEELLRPEERQQKILLHKLISDRAGMHLATRLGDLCFRDANAPQLVSYISHLLKSYGLPRHLPFKERISLQLAQLCSYIAPDWFLKTIRSLIRRQIGSVIPSAEQEPLRQHLIRRRGQGIKVNLNELGEAVLGQEEADRHFEGYLRNLSNPLVECISVKVSSIASQIEILGWEETVEKLAERLRGLYRAAIKNSFEQADGTRVHKLVNLDMEEYRDLELTVELFERVLDEDEFLHYSGGIVLQSYLPDSYAAQQRLTRWAQDRLFRGGAPIKLRLVKGANLAMERVEAQINGWQQAPFEQKWQTDANFIRMLLFGCQIEHAIAVQIGVASHNLFDIAYAMVLRSERQLEELIGFEMLEGMAPHLSRAVLAASSQLLLYTPVVSEKSFQTATAYLIRRLDENASPGNFLHSLFSMKVDDAAWLHQKEDFIVSVNRIDQLDSSPRRNQHREEEEITPPSLQTQLFINESSTDWSLPHHRIWVKRHLDAEYKKGVDLPQELLPLIIDGEKEQGSFVYNGFDPSRPGVAPYRYQAASSEQVKRALTAAKEASLWWGKIEICRRSQLLSQAAKLLRQQRGQLIAAMVCDAGKTVYEADLEVSEAIDFCEYYRRSAEGLEEHTDVAFKPMGAALVASPWNFPCAIPVGGIAANLAAGNSVLFKPAPQTPYIGWKIAQVFWEAGFSRKVLQFISGEDDVIGDALLSSDALDLITLTGSNETAKLFLRRRADLPLFAETGGKNSLIITEMADLDLAVRDAVLSAFSYAGQKCSACSLLILTGRVADDERFLKQLRDAAQSMVVGSAWQLSTKVPPLIGPPSEKLLQAMTQLEEDEEWLLEPKCIGDNPHLYAPAIKLGVRQNSFCFKTELFGPVLSVVKAKGLDEAIEMTKKLPYGLTSGLHSLDEREHARWLEAVEAGNCYINRTTVGAIVQRQPFGGFKKSNYGAGAKAGGPDYVAQFMRLEQQNLPFFEAESEGALPVHLKPLEDHVSSMGLDLEGRKRWKSALASYSHYWQTHFKIDHEPGSLLGQQNLFRYRPLTRQIVRLQEGDPLIDIMLFLAAALTAGTPAILSASQRVLSQPYLQGVWKRQCRGIDFREAEEGLFLSLLNEDEVDSVRFLSEPAPEMAASIGQKGVAVLVQPMLLNGRFELTRHLREQSISYDYHRYGYTK